MMDVTGLPEIICNALWAGFCKEKALYKNCIVSLLLKLIPGPIGMYKPPDEIRIYLVLHMRT